MKAILIVIGAFIGYRLYTNWYKYRPIYGIPYHPKLYNVKTGKELSGKPEPIFNKSGVQKTGFYRGQTIATY